MKAIAKKTKAVSALLTAIGALAFSAILCATSVVKNRAELFDFHGDNGDTLWGKLILEKEQVNVAFDKKIPGFDQFIGIYGAVQNVLGTSVYEDAGYTYVIRDKKNFLHFYVKRQDEAEYAEAVSRFAGRLQNAGIPLLYLQAPVREMRMFTEFPDYIDYASDENAAAMLDALEKQGVSGLSLGELLQNDGVDPASMFYRTDHHWTTQTAFRAFQLLLPHLNEQFGFSIDPALSADENWRAETFENYFLGSLGRRLGKELSGLDDYTYLEPAFETQYDVYYTPQSREKPYWSGSFRQTMVRESLLYSEDVSVNRYASYFQYDYGELIIRNRLCDNGLRIAVIKDSFALPFTAFLSTVFSEIEMIDLREYQGNVTEFLLDYKPDLVLMLYSNSTFQPLMYEFEGHAETEE
ncbi:MAG: hypothetical protein MJ175_02165 [Clostridia bacterium]|nr:hypothetical protein [Clostridia bacterium]